LHLDLSGSLHGGEGKTDMKVFGRGKGMGRKNRERRGREGRVKGGEKENLTL